MILRLRFVVAHLEQSQVFNEHHHRLQAEQRAADSACLAHERDPNIMLIQVRLCSLLAVLKLQLLLLCVAAL